MLHFAFGPTSGPIPFRRSSLRLSCDNMSPHQFKVYSMVKMDIDVHVANATVYVMKVLQPKAQPFLKGECIPMDVIFKPWVPRALESAVSQHVMTTMYDIRDPLRIYWKRNVDFRGPLANLMGLPVDALKVRLKDKNGLCIS
ncbi:hypothetical protein Gotur_015863 [Gossypium turneri]